MFDTFTGPLLEMFVQSFWETLAMVGISGTLGAAIGIPLGVYLRLTDTGGILHNPGANRVVGTLINAVRAGETLIIHGAAGGVGTRLRALRTDATGGD